MGGGGAHVLTKSKCATTAGVRDGVGVWGRDVNSATNIRHALVEMLLGHKRPVSGGGGGGGGSSSGGACEHLGSGGGGKGHVEEESAAPPKKRRKRAGWLVNCVSRSLL
ncbi:hypothetical protein CHLRE_09g401301v5 [Chlamydomonas reinhardtii]|uniref:Uncharacterized protein n=1 Tax=Chlamydomonas reinhardtii TaxID=3055 RepID=A0A2K3DCS9_CHLRE|nr:uncharacterized protein CHLRE_09g401301v5 [Chlamydomonas reinhardtii]PNW78339.1 hypothetical protein CHLRE_09g401301v5 [Chlamydomonas reinhardtii]